MAKQIDNRGLPCPQPVLNTKRALEEMGDSSEGLALVSIVDNEGARENILRLVGKMGSWTTSVEKKEDGIYIHIEKSCSSKGVQNEAIDPEEAMNCTWEELKGPIFLVTRSGLGSGSEELGKVLMRSFVATLKEVPLLPEKIMFLNSGVYLTVSGSQVLEDLLELEKMGVEIFSCGTCLDYYQLKDKLAVGQVTNMFDTVESLLGRARCVTI